MMNNSLYESLKVSPQASNKFVLLDDYKYKDVTVPVGFITNGADIPFLFRGLYPPYSPNYLPAIVVHDYLYSLGEYEKADLYFKELLSQLEVRKWRRISMVYGVNIHTFFKRKNLI